MERHARPDSALHGIISRLRTKTPWYYIEVTNKVRKINKEKSRFIRLERQIVEEVSHFLFALGNQFVTIKNANGAFDCFKYSIDLNPKHQPSVYNLGALYNIMGDTEGAYRMFKEAVRMKSDDRVAKIALGEVARKLGKMEEAREILEKVYEMDPEDYMILSAMAILLYDLGHLAEAMDWNDRALDKKPDDIHMVLNQALINMTFGSWAKWWSQYEFCLSYQKNERMRGMRMSDSWSGQELEGKTLLIISDQGSGDAMQFSRYFKEVAAKGKFGKICYLVQPDLKELLGRVDGVDEVLGFGEKMKYDFDAFSSLLGIMRVMEVDPANCWRPPHITTDPKLDEVWKYRVNSGWDKSSKKVGIVWAGDPKHGNDHARSLPFAQFAKLALVPGVQLFSFQVGPPVQQLHAYGATDQDLNIVNLGEDFRHFDDTASAIKEMDLVISCDTSVPHLGGCMGIPTWVLVPNPPEWRWLTDVGTTPWYRDAAVFRQKDPKNWDPVISAVLHSLQEFSGKGVLPGA